MDISLHKNKNIDTNIDTNIDKNIDKKIFIKIYNGKQIYISVNKLNKYELFKIIKKKYNINCNSCYLVYNNKIINDNNNITFKENDIIFLNSKIKGGIIGTIVDMLQSMVNFLKQLGGLIDDLLRIIWNLVEIIPTIFDPTKLIDDIIHGLMKGINTLFITLLNSLDLDTMRGKPKASTGSGAFGVTDKSKKVCVTPKLINLIILVLCPPLQLFLYKKMKGIFLVIICALMTYYLYYFPGLIFAALHVLC